MQPKTGKFCEKNAKHFGIMYCILCGIPYARAGHAGGHRGGHGRGAGADAAARELPRGEAGDGGRGFGAPAADSLGLRTRINNIE